MPKIKVERMKPRLYLYSDSGVKIPDFLKGKLGKIVELSIRAKVISERTSQEAGEGQRQSYDLEIQKISKLERALKG